MATRTRTVEIRLESLRVSLYTRAMQLRWFVLVGFIAACGQVATSSPDAAAPEMRTVTISVSGNGMGTITSSPAGIDCGTDCSEAFPDGTSITLTATAATGSTFMGWGDGSCSGTGDCVVTVGQDITIAPTFALANSIVVTIAGNGMGDVASAPAGISCPGDCSEQYGPGQTVTLTATPANESQFAGWANGGCTGTAPCVVTTDNAAAITATFNLKKYALTVTKGGNGTGTVTSAPAGISCGATCMFNFDSGATVTLTPAAATGSTFTGWGGACSGTGACSVSMTAVKTVTASFTLTQHALTVAKNGTGTGTVSSSPAGISCGATCSANFNYNTSVTLTPAATSGSTFTGWAGACTGTGACVVSMTTARSVTATFTKTTSFSCTTVANVKACTNGNLPEIALTGLNATQCHDQCVIKMPQAGMTSGCWVLAMNATCYCRNGVLDTTAGTAPGGSCM